jgi:hypothetical protein
VSNPMFLDMVSSATTVIEHPVDIVWHHLLEQAAWMTDFKVETVGGERHREGELKKLTPALPQYQPFFFKTLRLVPFRKFVYKAYTNDRSGWYGFTGVEILSLDNVGGETTVAFEAYLEVQTTTMTPKELADFVNNAKESSVALWQGNFQRLAALVASSSTS